MQKRARHRASEIGVSLAEYVRRVVARDLDRPEAEADVTVIFDIGSSVSSDIAKEKRSMIAEAFGAARRKTRR